MANKRTFQVVADKKTNEVICQVKIKDVTSLIYIN